MTEQRTTDPAGASRRVTDLRAGLRRYVHAMHEAYLAAGGGHGDDSLASSPFTVVVVAARSLHLIATREAVAAPAATEAAAREDVEVSTDTAETDALGGLAWRLLFLDPSVVAELGDIPAGSDEIAAVREVLGVGSTLYHLAAGPGAALTAHHATHTGTGLAHRELAGR
ncbi:MAG: hypothetical protein KY460_11150 [Actinobacteria bacterium]|nr:hypothetical protein [Actinomycetota bacterium]